MDLCGALQKADGVRHVMHFHGISPPKPQFLSLINDSRAYVGELLGGLTADAVVAVSNHLQRIGNRHYGMPRHRIHTIYNGVPDEFFEFTGEGSKPYIRSIGRTHKVLCVGTIAYVKGQHFVLEALRHVLERHPKTQLLLAGRIGRGEGRYYRKFIEPMLQRFAHGNVRILGLISDDQLLSLYHASDVFVSGTTWEGFGYPFAEAMASGLPVVGFRVAAVEEIVHHNETGLLAPCGDIHGLAGRISAILEDANLAESLGRKARQYAKRYFCLNRNARTLLELFEKVAR
jgi:glycosyltransferase involved in cell wall biosynthesis